VAVIQAEVNQAILKGGQRLPRRLLVRTLKTCALGLRLSKDKTISVAFVDDKTIRALNKKYRGKDKVTDILSFTTGKFRYRVSEFPRPGIGTGEGELLICYPQAKRQAKAMGHSVRDEIVFLIVHGVLHLHGFDHERPSEAKKMFSLQTKILKRLGVDPRV
jgi:probable rRNA maturation factor